ncbi:hypothetical protein GCM10027598_45880 [Amycolatopsis oliviviridis]|uniref:DUF4386 domain-containing protein n=1 Tax=Amycolatopsis oliviviridis TaxID=1471590 RepID=A0ABQ3L9Q8_9PSEU|nr:hypothetical protein GCM10017790_15960 [Amycolatopsis oliviviridis]
MEFDGEPTHRQCLDPLRISQNDRRGPALATAVQLASDPIGDTAATVRLLYLVSGNLWGVGTLFFGLWPIPLGQCALRSGWMPRTLGLLLIGGGIAYVLSAFTTYLAPGLPLVADALALPATVGEFWMIGYLLVRGVRRHAPHEHRRPRRHPQRADRISTCHLPRARRRLARTAWVSGCPGPNIRL